MSQEMPDEMNLKEFRDFGFLQEANRQFFHPLGLALTIVWDEDDPGNENGVDPETAVPTALYIQDWRQYDGEGGAFQTLDSEDARLKAERVAALHSEIAGVRTQAFGWNIQPIGHKFEGAN